MSNKRYPPDIDFGVKSGYASYYSEYPSVIDFCSSEKYTSSVLFYTILRKV